VSEATNAVADRAQAQAKQYQRGMNYLAGARRIAAVARRLDNGDAKRARKLADTLMDKGVTILAGVMKAPRRETPSASEG
jgi:soluble cytochrome b562